MPRQLYALLVGIDSYPQPVSSLTGAANDAQAFKSYLTARIAPDFEIQLCLLLNQDATRAAVIQGFEQHLSKAGPDDVALFVFSGHGSQQDAPEEFWDIEPDHRNETLVCWDSRLPGSWDLADKEIAGLIELVSRSGAHTVVILDCCHSGSGTRDLGIRQIQRDQRERSLSSFWGSAALEFSVSRDRNLPSRGEILPASRWRISKGDHILLAACASDEVARETTFDGMQRGVFSYHLLQLLANTNSPLTYRTLFRSAAARMLGQAGSQTPQIEPTNAVMLDLEFLSGAAAGGSRWFLVHHDPKRSWLVDAGAIHGIRPPAAGETALALFPHDTPDAALESSAISTATAVVTEVFLDASAVMLIPLGSSETVQNQSALFKAVVTATPVPPVGVAMDSAAAELIRERIQTAGPNRGPSLYVAESPLDRAAITVTVEEGRFKLRVTSAPEVPPDIFDSAGETARKIVARLETIAHWLAVRDLHNEPAQIGIQDVEIIVKSQGSTIERAEYRFVYSDSEAEAPVFTVQVTNRGFKPLYCAAVSLSETFAVEGMVDGGGCWLKRGETLTLAGGPIAAIVPDELWFRGVTNRRDLLKIIVAQTEFDATRLQSPVQPTDLRFASGAQSSLDQVLSRQSWRELKPAGAGTGYTDWRSFDLQITSVRPAMAVSIEAGGTSASTLAGGFVIEPHPLLKADVTPRSSADVARDTSRVQLPGIILAATAPLISGEGRATGLDILEFTSVWNQEAVTEESPLRITLNSDAEAEDLLVFGWDGEFFVPVGRTCQQGSRTLLEVHRMPAPTTDGRRSLTGSIRLYFRKVAARARDREFKGGVLAARVAGPSGSLERITGEGEIKELVTCADDVTILIHGIIGDTTGMVENARDCGFSGLLLTFDYENLNTTIEETARELGHALRRAGLSRGHTKRVRIVAHSIGGLVSRWLIEREDGSEIVSALLMAGTPNAGSPWPTVEEWATFAIGTALNGMVTMAWPLPAFGSLVRTANRHVAVTLRQMGPGSDFLKNLSAARDPEVSYTLLAGNTSYLRHATVDGQSRLKKLLATISPRSAAHGLLGLLFFRRPNDIAVSVESMRDMGEGRALTVIDVPCDHLTYFTAEAAQLAWKGLFRGKAAQQ